MFTMEITRLIERCRQGDADALGELYKAYAQRMRGVCRRYISDEQTVEDVLHDAFVIIFTSFDRLRDVRRAEQWMMAITRNVASKCKDHLEALPTVSLEETSEVGLIAAEDEERDVRGVPLSEVVRMIDRLPEGYGQVFRLSVFEGMTHKEIADMLGIEPHSSSSQLARAKKMLRKILDALIDKQRLYGSPVAMVGMQKRYAPAVQILRKRLRKEHFVSYALHYLIGNYPEGNALLDLYIHPLDLVTYLFGKPEIIACQQVASASYILMLRHPHIVGTLELSTAYTWIVAEESLKVCTSKGIYRLSQMEELTFEPKPSTILGVPYEKIHTHNRTVEYIYARNNFTPTLPNNQIYSQGYYSEIQSFITSIEHGHSSILTDITTIKPTYEVLMRIKRLFAESS